MKILPSCVLVLAFFFCADTGNSQLIINNANNAVQAVDTLLGEGVEVYNIVYTGNNDQIGTFQCTNCNLGIPTGMVMSTGSVSTAAGPNNTGSSSGSYAFGAGDPDLALLAGASLNDAAVLQFDFVPTGDSLVFDFVWGSEEYPEYSNSSFNDAFGFFLSGPGIDGVYSMDAVNLALIPGTTIPVTINNLNNGNTGTNGPCEFCQYYIHNGNGGQSPYNTSNFYIQPDGFTSVIQAYAPVQCGETYHIKIAIADAGDSGFNSYVFLEAASFSSNQLQLSFESPDLAPTDTSVYEGCSFGSLTFTRPFSQSNVESVFELQVGGTAINGTDYSLIPGSLVFPIGATEVELPIEAFSDLEEEELESIEIVILSGVACVSSDTAAFTLWIQEIPPLTSTISDVEINCGDSVLLQPDIDGGIGLYSIQWSTGESAASIYVDPLTETSYFYTVFDTCNVTPAFGTVTVGFPEYPPLVADAGPDLVISCLTELYAEGSGTGGYGSYDYEWTYNGAVISLEEIVQLETVPNEGPFTLSVSDACNTEAFDSFEVTFPDETINIDIGDDQQVTCLSQVTVTAIVSGGVGTYSYLWEVDGEVADDDPTVVVPGVTTATDLALTITDQCGNVESAQIEISVLPTGLNVDLGSDFTVNCLDVSTIFPTVFGGAGDFTFEWTVDGVVESTASTLTVQTDEDLLISLSVTDQCGFSDTDLMEVDAALVPVNLSITPGQTICPGEIVDIEVVASGGTGTLGYNWSPVSGNTASVQVSPEEATTYSVSVSDECGSAASASSTVGVYIAEEPFAVSENFELCVGVPSEVVVTGGVLPYTFTYNLDTLDFIDGNAFYGWIPGPALVTVQDLCLNQDSFVIDVSGCSTSAVNIFTPNGDGDNDTFVINGLDGYPNSGLTVYNRWGSVVFEDPNYSNQWNGGEAPGGTYYWTLNRSDDQQFSGWVMLLRAGE